MQPTVTKILSKTTPTRKTWGGKKNKKKNDICKHYVLHKGEHIKVILKLHFQKVYLFGINKCTVLGGIEYQSFIIYAVNTLKNSKQKGKVFRRRKRKGA